MLHRKQLFSFFLALLAPSVLFAKASRYPADSACVPYRSLDGSQIALPIFINHSGPYDFMVDTGAQLTLVDPLLAAQLNLAPLGPIGLITGIHRASVDMTKAELVEAGPVAVQDLTVAVVGLRHLQAANPRLRGVLGENFLGRFDMLLDYDHKVVCLDPSKALQNQLQGEHVPVIEHAARDGNLAYSEPVQVAVRIHGAGQPEFVLRVDSGSNAPMLYEHPLGTPWWMLRDHVRKGGAAGNHAALSFATMPKQVVEIGSHLEREIAFLTPISSQPPTVMAGEDGILPTILFKRVFISYADHFVIFDPR